MDFNEWFIKKGYGSDVLSLVYYLQKQKPYTNEEIIETIERIEEISEKNGLSLSEIISIMVVNETTILK